MTPPPPTPARVPIRLHDADHSPTVVAGRRAADAARRVIGALVGSTASPEDLTAAASTLEDLAERLVPFQPAASRYEGTRGLGVRNDRDSQADAAVFEHHPFVGPSSPLAPPLVIQAPELPEGERGVEAIVTYDHRHEGPPGHVHGGIIAGAFDLVLAATAGTARRPAVTGTLTIRYRKPTPLHTELRFAGRVAHADDRKVRCTGTASTPDGTVVCEADGLFIVVPDERFRPGDGPE
jgi:acyl-coenzyme A thioesterase PaaI-like protein